MATVVILLSDKRSGSTILQDELCRHANVQHVKTSPHTYSETHHWLEAAVILDRPAALYSGGVTYKGYGGQANARAYMKDLLEANIPGYQAPEDDNELVFGGWDALCQHFGQEVFFEKSPQVLAHWAALDLLLQWVETTDHVVRIIGLVRNPLAVQYSAKALFTTDPNARQYGWLEIQRNLLAVQSALDDDQFCLVRYEDMIARPEDIFAELCDFIGIARDPAIGSEVNSGSLDKWRLDPEYDFQLDPAVARFARFFGYEGTELQNPTPAGQRSAKVSMRDRVRTMLNGIRHRTIKPIILRLGLSSDARR